MWGHPHCGWGVGFGWDAVQKVLTELRKNDGLKDRHLIVSIAAGVTLGSMQVSYWRGDILVAHDIGNSVVFLWFVFICVERQHPLYLSP